MTKRTNMSRKGVHRSTVAPGPVRPPGTHGKTTAPSPAPSPAPVALAHRKNGDPNTVAPVIALLGIKMSLSKISRETGLSLSHVSKIFNAQRLPSIDVASQLAALTRVSIDELIRAIRKVRTDTAAMTMARPSQTQ